MLTYSVSNISDILLEHVEGMSIIVTDEDLSY